ncbi:Zinc finger protein ZAT10 [Camellia lanceoleosa]|uniref:Zinc finger protein ZAT10 n=1 Tax=Camellia lanceoleosa TaxID=1840588 RepID=A0ACC0GN61_9ERIC|nr:Zinc finger protein ZAT10 [Camellia lanceoleosa]
MENHPTEEEYLALCLIMLAPGSTSSASQRRHSTPPPSSSSGGHKRCHYDGGSNDGGSSSVTSSEGVGSTNSHRGFDLNLPAALPQFCPRFAAEEEVESPHPAKKPVFYCRLNPCLSVYITRLADYGHNLGISGN